LDQEQVGQMANKSWAFGKQEIQSEGLGNGLSKGGKGRKVKEETILGGGTKQSFLNTPLAKDKRQKSGSDNGVRWVGTVGNDKRLWNDNVDSSSDDGS